MVGFGALGSRANAPPKTYSRFPVARLEREAKLLASLNHPNIASICGFEESRQPERSATLPEG